MQPLTDRRLWFLIIYLHGPGSARSQAVLCVKTFFVPEWASPSRREKKVWVVFKKERKKCHPRLAWLYVDRGGKASLLIKSSLSQSVKAAQITKTVIQLKLMLKKKLNRLATSTSCLYGVSASSEEGKPTLNPPLSASLSPKSPPRRYPLISVDTLLDS